MTKEYVVQVDDNFHYMDENFIAVAYLIAGKLSRLPASPSNTTACARAS
jgi:hypothetical protein